VGEPSRRFEEDALRILRALRFASTLGFDIEEETATAARAAADRLKTISAERIREELTKLLLGEKSAAILANFSDIIAVVLPKWARYTLADEKKASALSAWLAAAPKDPVSRYTVFFSCLPPTEAEAEMDGLRFDHRTRDRVVKLLSHLNDPCGSSANTARPFLAGLGGQDALLLLDLRIAACHARGADSWGEEAAKAAVTALLAEEGECSSVSDLAVGGKELIALGLSEGKPLGLALRSLLAAVVAGNVKNEKQALLAYVEKHILNTNCEGEKQ
jgi:tRNA nucleotidyltransferase (CCA-adding enzyme)